MEPKIILRFRNASKAGTSLEFPVKQFRNVNIGRDHSCEVAYNSDTDDLVSRLHAKITIEAANPPSYSIADCESRNGTFLNHQRITGSAKLNFGDLIQLGPGGPEISVEMEPRPAVAKLTRLATEVTPPAAASTRPVSPVVPAAPPPVPAIVVPPSEKVALGKQTVERMIASEQTKTSRKSIQIAVGAAAALVMVAGTLAIPAVRDKVFSGGKLSATEIAKATGDSVVYFEAGWKLVDTESGRSLYQLYIPNRIAEPAQQPQAAPTGQPPPTAPSQPQAQLQQQQQPAAEAAPAQPPAPQEPQVREIIPGGPPMLPAFIQLDGGLEPILTTEAGEGGNKPVGGRHSGTGFVVSADGFVLTNRHVAASWMSRYSFASPVGIVIQSDGQGNRKLIPISNQQFPQWVPSRSRFILRGRFDPNGPLTAIAVGGKAVEGRNDYLDITFPKNRERVQAKLVRNSDTADVAMVKIDMPRSLRKIELNDNYESIAQGDEISVMGYPGVSPAVIGAVQSKEALTPTLEQRIIPDPTLSIGNIGRIIRGKAGLTEATYSQFGDVYQLTINSTGAGNSGGPVLDSRGRVIGIFTYAIQMDARITFAVPIRYGMELMGTTPVM